MFGFLLGAMLIGGTIKGFSRLGQYNDEYKQYMEDTQDQIEEYNRQLEQKEKDLDLNFQINTDEANKKADKSDAQSTLNEGYTADKFNNELDQIKANQEGETLAFNQQAMQNGQATGDALSDMAASGTRGSSLETAVDLQAALNEQQLQAQEDQARAGDNIQLANLFGNFNQSVNQIQTDRIDALDLRKSFMEGGNQWKLYQNDKTNLHNDYAAAINSIEKERKRARDNYGRNAGHAFFGGFSSGMQTGAKVVEFGKKWL